jgi:hypothetical protein
MESAAVYHADAGPETLFGRAEISFLRLRR